MGCLLAYLFRSFHGSAAESSLSALEYLLLSCPKVLQPQTEQGEKASWLLALDCEALLKSKLSVNDFHFEPFLFEIESPCSRRLVGTSWLDSKYRNAG